MSRLVVPPAVILFSSVTLSGCATMLHSSDGLKFEGQPAQWVEITSEPSGALVTFGSTQLGRTPLRAALPRKNKSIVLRVWLDGYEPQVLPVPRSVSGAVAGNLGFVVLGATPAVGFADPPKAGGRVAMAVTAPVLFMLADFSSGNAYTLPKRLHVLMVPRR